MDNDLGTRAQYLILDAPLMKCAELTMAEKLVLAYVDQIEPYEAPGDSCADFLDLSVNEVNRAKQHLLELNLIKENE